MRSLVKTSVTQLRRGECPECGENTRNGRCPICDDHDQNYINKVFPRALPQSTPSATARNSEPDFLAQARSLAKEKSIRINEAMSQLASQNPELHQKFIENSAASGKIREYEREFTPAVQNANAFNARQAKRMAGR